jgi:hypothetical protein
MKEKMGDNIDWIHNLRDEKNWLINLNKQKEPYKYEWDTIPFHQLRVVTAVAHTIPEPEPPAPKDTCTSVEHEQCKICLDNKRCVLFDPCGHIVSCWSCSGGLNTCPLCREAVTKRIKAFI